MSVFPKDRPLTDAERREWMDTWVGAKAVGWELYALAQGLVSTPAETGMAQSLLLEGTLVHQRCLIEFLVGRVDPKGKRRWKDAYDFTAPGWCAWDPEVIIPTLVPVLDAGLDEIDKYMAHISRQRATFDRRTWDLAPVSAAIFEGVRAYLPVLQAADSFRAKCLGAYFNVAAEHAREHGVDLDKPLVITPTSSLMYVTPIGESPGRAAGLMARGEAQQEADANDGVI